MTPSTEQSQSHTRQDTWHRSLGSRSLATWRAISNTCMHGLNVRAHPQPIALHRVNARLRLVLACRCAQLQDFHPSAQQGKVLSKGEVRAYRLVKPGSCNAQANSFPIRRIDGVSF
mmetsp:Transcript_30282/g.82845  ORF Transcript_30282/g.82845 Transcript_30282/m.82845 type:complete len:116 (+) Transcript_30282:1208-1555(+)